MRKPATSEAKDIVKVIDVNDLAYETAEDQASWEEFLNDPNVRLTVERAARHFWRRFGRSDTYPEPRDLEQEIWVKLVMYINTFEKRARFRTWLNALARNLAVDAWRRQTNQPTISQHYDRALQQEPSSDDAGREALLRICVSRFSKSEYELLQCFLARKSIIETAEALKMKKSTVHNKLMAIRKKIKTAVGP